MPTLKESLNIARKSRKRGEVVRILSQLQTEGREKAQEKRDRQEKQWKALSYPKRLEQRRLRLKKLHEKKAAKEERRRSALHVRAIRICGMGRSPYLIEDGKNKGYAEIEWFEPHAVPKHVQNAVSTIKALYSPPSGGWLPIMETWLRERGYTTERLVPVYYTVGTQFGRRHGTMLFDCVVTCGTHKFVVTGIGTYTPSFKLPTSNIYSSTTDIYSISSVRNNLINFERDCKSFSHLRSYSLIQLHNFKFSTKEEFESYLETIFPSADKLQDFQSPQPVKYKGNFHRYPFGTDKISLHAPYRFIDRWLEPEARIQARLNTVSGTEMLRYGGDPCIVGDYKSFPIPAEMSELWKKALQKRISKYKTRKFISKNLGSLSILSWEKISKLSVVSSMKKAVDAMERRDNVRRRKIKREWLKRLANEKRQERHAKKLLRASQAKIKAPVPVESSKFIPDTFQLKEGLLQSPRIDHTHEQRRVDESSSLILSWNSCRTIPPGKIYSILDDENVDPRQLQVALGTIHTHSLDGCGSVTYSEPQKWAFGKSKQLDLQVQTANEYASTDGTRESFGLR